MGETKRIYDILHPKYPEIECLRSHTDLLTDQQNQRKPTKTNKINQKQQLYFSYISISQVGASV